MNPSSSFGHKWILVAIDYFTKWTKEIALKDATKYFIIEFLDGIMTRFGAPSTIISDNEKSFLGAQIYA